ncbi:MAG TPA: S8 family serine peptidase, partial [Bacteroidota bacterium]
VRFLPVVLCGFFIAPVATADARTHITPRLAAALVADSAGGNILCMVYLTDRGDSPAKYAPRELVTPRALQRRAHVLPPGGLVDDDDLPLNPVYVSTLAAHVAQVRNLLKWFNAVSVAATPAQIRALAELPFVREVDLVGRYRRRSGVETFTEAPQSPSLARLTAGIDYGESLHALAMIHVPEVHATGNHAEGIIIGMLDNGVRLLSHTALDSIRPRILATHDFVDHKVSVVPNNPDPSFGAHGVFTLSAIGGFKPGRIVGPAFGASFILARTENDSSETPIEEDNWAAAIQWAESLGVQVTSTSLGYLAFDSGYVSLTWEDMNGRTAHITQAAAKAVRKGVVVVNSAGNNRFDPSHNTLDAPADGDSVIAVGAVNPSGGRSGFSSVGPTTSVPPHIKPDVMAQGEDVAVASAVNDTAYGAVGGTSLSCPQVAGVAALILRAHPDATPYDVMTRLHATASNASAPNNLIGWGIANAVAAVVYPEIWAPPAANSFTVSSRPNPFTSGTVLSFLLPEPSQVSITVYDILGREVKDLSESGAGFLTGNIRWSGDNAAGARVAAGVYFIRFSATGASGAVRTQVSKVVLMK